MAGVTEEQLRELVERLGSALVLYARQWCDQPDDALQEALIELAGRDSAPANLSAWIFQTVRYKALSLARSERRRVVHQRGAASQREDWFESDLSLGIDGATVAQCLAELSALEREIVVGRIWGELSFAQIAELVDRPVTSVYRQYKTAIARLQVGLGLQRPGGESSTIKHLPENQWENRLHE